MRFIERFKGQHMIRRFVVMIIAVIVMGFGVSLLVLGNMGTDPYSTLNLGVASKIGLSFGVWQMIFNAVLLIAVVIFDRSMLGAGTLGNMFLVGFSADFFKPIWEGLFPDADGFGFMTRLAITLLGVAFLILGCSFYVTSDLGTSPYDSVSFIVPNKTKIPFRWWRIISDCICVGIGFACGAAVGIGTIIMAFGTGPLLPLCNKYIAGPVLGIKNSKTDI